MSWQAVLNRQGWLAPGRPKEFGGPGWTPMQRHIFSEEMARASAPPPQFGRPLGSFQALQHRLAAMVTEIEQVRSATINVGVHLDAPRDLRERHVSAAKALVGRVGRLVVEETIQMHGGIGMTGEYELAHLARRLTAVDSRYGNHLWHLSRFIALGRTA